MSDDDLCYPFKPGQRVRLTRVIRRQMEKEGTFLADTVVIKSIEPFHQIQWIICLENVRDKFSDDCFVAIEVEG
jgi:hypothetical protein